MAPSVYLHQAARSASRTHRLGWFLHLRRHGLYAVATIGLVASLTAPTASATASGPGGQAGPPDWLSEVRDSRSLTTPVAVRGTVAAPDGSAPAANADVYLQAWPNADDLAQLREGDPVEPTPIAKVQTDAQGRYQLRLDPAVDVEHLKSPRGSLDLELVAMRDGDIVVHHFPALAADPGSAAVGDGQALYTHPRTGEVLAPMAARMVIGSPGSTRRDGNLDEAVDGVPVPPNPADANTDTGTDGGEVGDGQVSIAGHYNGACPGGTGLKKHFGNRLVNVGNVHLGVNGKSMRFTYTGSADSALGTAISTTGSYGTWSVSGTVTGERSTSSTLSTSFPWYTSATSRYLDTYFSYGRFCVEYYDSMHGVGHRYLTRRIRHEGGTNSRTASIPATPDCIPYKEAGSTGSKTSTNAVTWTDGAKLAGAIGIDLSSRTGWRTDAKTEFKFVTPGRLCGTHDMPAGSPRRLVMRKP